MPDAPIIPPVAPLVFPAPNPLSWLGIEDLTADEMEAFDLLLSLWPPGAWHELYDVDNPRSDVRRFFGASGQALAKYGTGQAAKIKSELMPTTAVDKLPDWEETLGLPATKVPPTTTAGRQAAVVSKLRESGSYSLPEVRAILGPLLGYANANLLAIVETNRAGLRTLHTYSNATSVGVAGPGSVSRSVIVSDDAAVSAGGVMVSLNVAVVTGSVVATLTAPDGKTATWTLANTSGSPLVLRAGQRVDGVAATAFARILGTWTFSVVLATGSTVAWLSLDLFVEGAGLDAAKNDGRGAEVWYWGAFANPALEGIASASDREAARRAIERIKPAHTRGALLLTITPQPGALVPSGFIPAANP